jgi:hypothetical protein
MVAEEEVVVEEAEEGVVEAEEEWDMAAWDTEGAVVMEV